jgi:peptide-methionine (R)-S-oxide reductase
MKTTLRLALLVLLVSTCWSEPPRAKVVKSDAEWKKVLTPLQYDVLRKSATERPFTGEYTDHKQEGSYCCAACGSELFTSNQKFHSGCGWPAFFAVAAKEKVILLVDNSLGMQRTEVRCATCDGHLGHLFDDGPKPTGKRYCINSVCLKFKPKSAR